MKNIKFLFLLAFLSIAMFSCDEDVSVDTGLVEGGFIEVKDRLIPHVIASQTAYNATIRVFQGTVKTQSVAVYKQYKGALGTSDRILLTTVSIDDTSIATDQTISFTYANLATGVSLNGAAFPADDELLSVGDFFELSYEPTTSLGNTVRSATVTKVALSGRFAGVYIVGTSAYVHPTAGDQGGWEGDEVVIESVDDITYHILANGPWDTSVDPDNEFYFTVDGDGNITIPKEYDGTTQTVWGGADEVANCDDDPNELPDANCSTSNITIKDDVNGEDEVIMSHGYIRDSGTRQFYYELKKKI
jgi:hypothetical protein